MASKTIWIVGGVVVAIGVVAYVAFKPGPANIDTAGTVVEAKRAISDGATSSAPATPGDRSTDQPANDNPAVDQRANEQRANEQRANEQRANEQRANEQRANEQRANEQRANEQRANN